VFEFFLANETFYPSTLVFGAGSSRSLVQFVDVPAVGALFDGVTYGAYVDGSAHQMVRVAVFSEELYLTQSANGPGCGKISPSQWLFDGHEIGAVVAFAGRALFALDYNRRRNKTG